LYFVIIILNTFPFCLVIEVSSGEYGNHTDAMAAAVENGKILRWTRPGEGRTQPGPRDNPIQSHKGAYNFSSSGFQQFSILFKRMMIQQWRDPVSSFFYILDYCMCPTMCFTSSLSFHCHLKNNYCYPDHTLRTSSLSWNPNQMTL